ncbi:hypothetical protein [Cellulomonas aerilata]|uniref:Uncharacterized protein n=1 Tax=Cellulomonas aerilata TaxID=515326 RepID=A0A512DGB2_9CELL|nr:hypothetical protein [Cellulomonas aerilata]GEO35529.1 hypothetical protein CAE01nite_32540 [Cellulomonas aerilata]
MADDAPTPPSGDGRPAAAQVALVVTPVAGPGPLAATCAMAKVAVDVVPSTVGAIAVCRDLTGGAPREAAIAISRLLKGVPVVLLERSGGHVSASRWLDGEQGEDLAAGLVLSGAPEVLEDLLLGTTTPAEVDGAVSSVGLSRFRALRMLAASARANRR